LVTSVLYYSHDPGALYSFPTRRSSDLGQVRATGSIYILGHLYGIAYAGIYGDVQTTIAASYMNPAQLRIGNYMSRAPDYETEGRSEEHTSELQSRFDLVCRLLLEKKNL